MSAGERNGSRAAPSASAAAASVAERVPLNAVGATRMVARCWSLEMPRPRVGYWVLCSVVSRSAGGAVRTSMLKSPTRWPMIR